MSGFLTLSNITKSFKQGSSNITVLKELNFKFDFNKSYAITGPSGCGKSTLINLIAGTDLPNSGQIDWCADFKVNQLNQTEKSLFWNQKIGLVFQQPGLINELSVLENVALKGLIGRHADAFGRAAELLHELGLSHRLKFFPNLLSRGEQQRVAIARAMMCNVQLLLADEPTASLDQANGEQVINLLINLSKKYQMGLIVSTHDEYVYQKMNHVLTIVDCKINLKIT